MISEAGIGLAAPGASSMLQFSLDLKGSSRTLRERLKIV